VPALVIDDVRDTTGAGDAFAAGLLVALAGGATPVAAAQLGHHSAARLINAASGGVSRPRRGGPVMPSGGGRAVNGMK